MDRHEARATAGSDTRAPWVRPPADLSGALEGARRGEEHAFRLVYRALQPGLLRYVRGLVGSEAEDVASEAWVQIARDIGKSPDNDDDFRGWAITVARNRALDYLRKQRRRPAVSMAAAFESLEERASPEDTETRVLESFATDGAIALIGSLPRDQAEAVLLRVVVGLDVSHVAQILGKRPGAVRTATHRGLRRLAHLLEERHGQE